MKQRFAKGGFNKICLCRVCGKRTHSSIDGNLDIQLCRPCLEAAEMENEHSDGHHRERAKAECLDCRIEARKKEPV